MATPALNLEIQHDRADYAVIHAIAGRIRLRVPALKEISGLAASLCDHLGQTRGIFEVRANSWCGSLTITFDPDLLSLDDVFASLDKHQLRAVEETRLTIVSRLNGDSVLGGLLSTIERVAPSSVQLFLGTAAFAAALIEAPLFLTNGLLMAAVAPIAGRAVRTVAEERKVGVDALDGIAAIIMIAQRNLLSAGFMTALIGLGEYIRERTAQKCRMMMSDLLGLVGRSAWVVRGKKRIMVPADQVCVGETVVVYTGEMVPVDGIVTGGTAIVDQASLTGESIPAEVGPNDQVFAATVVLEGKVYVRCTAAGADTRAGLVMELVAAAPIHETKAQNYAAQLGDKMVVPILVGSGLCFALTGNIARTLSMLIFDFATGIRIAAPTAVLASMERAARRGILIKSGGALERLATVDAILFDKTGTLTSGEPHVTEIVCLNELSFDEVLALAAAVEQRLHHPAARAIVKFARHHSITIPDRAESAHTRGMGVKAYVNDKEVQVGSKRMMEAAGIDVSPALPTHAMISARGESLAYVAVDGKLAGVIAYKDQLRSDVAKVIATLKRYGIKEIVMATGDIETTANSVARAVGIDTVLAGAFPEHKAELVQQLKARGLTVAVVGDGINDSPALAHADVAISLHGGTDAARESADVVLTDDNLQRLPEAIDIARSGMRLVQQTIGLVAIPNGAGLALAAAGIIGPAMATLLNNGTAIVSALNSLSPLYADIFSPGENVTPELPPVA